MTILQLAVAAADLTVAAECLYLLVSPELTVGYGEFLGMYLLAVVAVVMTHVPGGVGVFELIVLTLAAPRSSATMVAALLTFRVIYYLLPLLVAALLLALNEIALQRVAAERIWHGIGRWVGSLAPALLAWTTLIAGAVLLGPARRRFSRHARVCWSVRFPYRWSKCRTLWAVWREPAC